MTDLSSTPGPGDQRKQSSGISSLAALRDKILPRSTGNCVPRPRQTQREEHRGCVCVTESLCCSSEVNTARQCSTSQSRESAHCWPAGPSA